MNREINIEAIKNDVVLKKVFANAFYNAKADEIFMNLKTINSSREKDEEVFRWRYAINLSIITEADLLGIMIENFAKIFDDKTKSREEIKKLNNELGHYCEYYKSKLDEKESFERQNKEIKSYGIVVQDIDLDFDKMVQVYNSASEEFKFDNLNEKNNKMDKK